MSFTLVTREQFAAKSWQRSASYAFAAQLSLLPVVVAELVKLVPAMPLGFTRAGDGFQLVAISSLRPGTNLFVAADGTWIGDYIPAILRAYPFQLINAQDGPERVLGFDTESGLLGDAGQGEAFFDADGPSAAVKGVLDFLSGADRSRVLTQQLVDALHAAELIQSWPLSIQQGEQVAPVEGLYRIDEAALNALADEAFLGLRKLGALGMAYGQLLSMNELAALQKAAASQARISRQLPPKAEIAPENSANLRFRFAQGETFKFS